MLGYGFGYAPGIGGMVLTFRAVAIRPPLPEGVLMALVRGMKAEISPAGVTASGSVFTLGKVELDLGERYVARLALGAKAEGGSNKSLGSVRTEHQRNVRAYLGALCAALLRSGAVVEGSGLKARREALSASQSASALIPFSFFEGEGDNDGARATMALYRDGLAIWEYILGGDPNNVPGLIRAIREPEGWRVFLSAE